MLPGIGGSYQFPVESYKERRFRDVIKQQYDFSCGSAALATLLTYHYQFRVNEQEVFEGMLEHADAEKVRREGFSMLDMKRYLQARGYKADGFRLTLDQLNGTVKVPAVTIINTNGYNHFVVVRGVREDRVLVADPAVGARVFTREEFEAGWNGLVFLIRSHADAGRSSYNTDLAWQGHNEFRYGNFLRRQSVSQFLVGLPGQGNY
ncbi:C39 family peptidase [Pseudomaricurvus sp. HS19]|uniref:C39 family peptidase n=1 Tax=Pseudomaricurvus sp. HS19 TaxID=2692626 RepID=UPI00192965A6|nr:C39 family peptidase [Pseudomaricurvus sp. HS19]